MKHSAKIVGQGRIVGRLAGVSDAANAIKEKAATVVNKRSENAGGKSRLPRFPRSTLDCLWLNVLRGCGLLVSAIRVIGCPLQVYDPNTAGGYAESLENLPIPVKCACAANVFPCVEMFAGVEAWQLFSRLHRHGQGLWYSKKLPKAACVFTASSCRVCVPTESGGCTDADSLEPDDRIDRRDTSNRNGRVEEKLGVEVQDVALINHGHAIDLERDVKRPEDTQVYKLVGRCAVGVIRPSKAQSGRTKPCPALRVTSRWPGVPSPGVFGSGRSTT